MESVLLDARAIAAHYHQGRPPRNKGEHYPADPLTVEEMSR